MNRVRCLVVAIAAVACADRQDRDASPRATRADSAQVDSSMAIVARAASVAIAMDAPDANADSVLAGAGLTVEAYEALMYRVARDTALTRLFEEATEKR